MRFRLGTVFIAVVTAAAILAPSTPASADIPESPPKIVAITEHPLTPQNAPADEYFGRLKLSNLGMRNIIHALAVEGTSPLALPLERTRIMGVETGLAQWGDLYPRDTWLRGSMLNFATVLAGKHDVDTDRIAVDTLLLASERYRNTAFAKVALARLRGVTPTIAVDWTVVPDPPTLSDTTYLH